MTRDIGGSAPAVLAQDSVPDAPAPQVEDKDTVTLRNTPVHILKDQAAVWTSPIHVRAHDLVWLAPFAAATGAGIATDHHVMASVVSHDASFNQANVNTSNALIGGFIAAPVAFYGFGHFHQDAHAREAGILSGEALVDGVVVEQGFKLIFWRERPNLDNARGLFFQSTAGWDSSLPSSHSVLAWSAAAVIAGEYPSRWTQLGVYSLASGVSLTRVLGQQHFPTDVLVGSLAGWLIGHYVYRTHHRPSRGGHR
jgi:membrane-associated phospholipid phosphatase